MWHTFVSSSTLTTTVIGVHPHQLYTLIDLNWMDKVCGGQSSKSAGLGSKFRSGHWLVHANKKAIPMKVWLLKGDAQTLKCFASLYLLNWSIRTARCCHHQVLPLGWSVQCDVQYYHIALKLKSSQSTYVHTFALSFIWLWSNFKQEFLWFSSCCFDIKAFIMTSHLTGFLSTDFHTWAVALSSSSNYNGPLGFVCD